MNDTLERVMKLHPDLMGVRVAINSVSTPELRELATELFDRGATLTVADEDTGQVFLLNRVLHERSGSVTRYRVVPAATVEYDPVDLFIEVVPLLLEKSDNAGYKRKIKFDYAKLPTADPRSGK